MSKGSKIIQVRIKEERLRGMDMQIAQLNIFSKKRRWTRSAFIQAAIDEKLAKMERSRKSHGKGPRLAPVPV